MSYFVQGPYGWVECDNRMIDGLTPTLGTRPHPRPQHWHDIRKEALERDGWKCVISNHRGRIEVHHRSYDRWGYEKVEDVYTLCSDCHKLFHESGRLAS